VSENKRAFSVYLPGVYLLSEPSFICLSGMASDMNSNSTELISVFATMGILFILALVAVYIFIRQWRREQKDKNKTPER
jgi:heme/copper-type cytochrome/quinol oxidase subunit 2